MGIIRDITKAIGRWFAHRQSARHPNGRQPDVQAHQWAEDIDAHLQQLHSKRTLRIRHHNTRPECSCMMVSMLDAYILYVSLPYVLPEKVQAWCSADDLFYTYERWPQVSLILTDRTLRDRCDAVIRLINGEDTLFTIRIILESRQNQQLVTYNADNQNQ